MDYLDLFKERDSLYSENFVCACFREAGQVHLTLGDDYPMLFVLSGGVTLVCEGLAAQTFRSGNLVIVDRKRISAVYCLEDTILLEYALPKDLSVRFQQHPTCFKLPCLPVVPISGRLETWVERQFQTAPDNSTPQDDELVKLLLKYQKRRLKTAGGIMKDYLEQKELYRRRGVDNNNSHGKEYGLPELI